MYNNDQNNVDGEVMDKELADLTDALFAGGDMKTSDNIHELDTITRQLYQLIAPNTPPDPAFRAHLTQRLNEEWALADIQRRRTSRSRPSPSRRLLMIAAVLILVIGVSVVIFLQNGPTSVTGFAHGGIDSTGGVLVVLGVLAVLTVIVVWRGRR